MKKPTYKVFNAKTVRKAFKDCLKEGFRPLTEHETMNAAHNNHIPKQWYDTGTFWMKKRGVWQVQDVTNKKELLKIFRMKSENVRSVCVGSLGSNRGSTFGDDLLGSGYGRLAGVK